MTTKSATATSKQELQPKPTTPTVSVGSSQQKKKIFRWKYARDWNELKSSQSFTWRWWRWRKTKTATTTTTKIIVIIAVTVRRVTSCYLPDTWWPVSGWPVGRMVGLLRANCSKLKCLLHSYLLSGLPARKLRLGIFLFAPSVGPSIHPFFVRYHTTPHILAWLLQFSHAVLKLATFGMKIDQWPIDIMSS